MEPTTLESLYLAPPAVLLSAIQESDGPNGTVLVIGHNPGLTMLAHALTGDCVDAKTAQALQRGLATGGFALLDIAAADWLDLAPRKATLVACLAP